MQPLQCLLLVGVRRQAAGEWDVEITFRGPRRAVPRRTPERGSLIDAVRDSGLSPTNVGFDGVSDRNGPGIEFANLLTDAGLVQQLGEGFGDIGASYLTVELGWP